MEGKKISRRPRIRILNKFKILLRIRKGETSGGVGYLGPVSKPSIYLVK